MKLQLLAQQELKSLTPAEALQLKRGDMLLHNTMTYADGIRPMKFKVTGRPKVWKRSGAFRVPIKFGLSGHHQITEENCSNYSLKD